MPARTARLRVYTGGQSVYDEHRETVHMLGVPEEKVRVISKYVGGGFGGKEDISCSTTRRCWLGTLARR